MNVSCPECQSVFRVDPARVPGPGIRARCSVCGGIIPITATRSWTDDFATPHDAASLLTSSRGGARPGAAGAAALTEAQTASGRAPAPSFGVSAPGAASPAMPRPVTPTRVPPFSPGRRPTPPSAPVQSAPPNAASSAAPLGQGPAAPPRPSGPAAPELAAPGTHAPPGASRVPDVPIGAPISRSQPAAPPGGGSAASPIAPVGRDATPASAPMPRTRATGPGGETPSPVRAGAEAAAGRSPINPFLANDPNQKAKRLARALVSDMVAYHPQKRDEGMRAGTLKQLFREEIKKSYEEYVEQIGKEFAESTSHFQDALNDVLAGGKKVF